MKREAEVFQPFNAIRKVFPNGDVFIKKFNFQCQKKVEGYEPIECFTENDLSGHWLGGYNEDVPHPLDEVKPLGSFVPVVPDVEAEEEKRRKRIVSNIAITRNKIFDIASSNEFNYFITLTYSADKADRYSFTECSKKVRVFMNHFRCEHAGDCPNFKYLLIHEQHKDGAYHYHGLIYLEDIGSLRLADVQPKKCSYPVYNWARWKNGFSTVTPIGNLEACRNYILKYISKNIDEDYVKGQRHFYYSQNCQKPIYERMMFSEDDVEGFEEVYSTDRSTGYQLTASDHEALSMASLYSLFGDDLKVED